MKKVISGKLYDTETAKYIADFERKVTVDYHFYSRRETAKCALYKTENHAWFAHIGYEKGGYIEALSEEKSRNIIGEVCPDEYQNYFPVEEA